MFHILTADSALGLSEHDRRRRMDEPTNPNRIGCPHHVAGPINVGPVHGRRIRSAHCIDACDVKDRFGPFHPRQKGRHIIDISMNRIRTD